MKYLICNSRIAPKLLIRHFFNIFFNNLIIFFLKKLGRVVKKQYLCPPQNGIEYWEVKFFEGFSYNILFWFE
jgi:hypothetical protein